MARPVRVCALGPAPFQRAPGADLRATAARAMEHWDGWIDRVLPGRPDFILVHEACDRPLGMSRADCLDYYASRGTSILEHFQALARREGVNLGYCAALPAPDGSLRNRLVFIGRDGAVRGAYNKNHLVWEEYSELNIRFGRKAGVVQMDFGSVAGAICFDLNFAELREKYEASRPELIAFSSMYHGGFVQQQWAYACRSWFLGAVAGLPCAVINPLGEIEAQSTNYFPYVAHRINLDFEVAHLDYNWEKLDALRRKYGPGVTVRDPGFLGAVLIVSECDVPAREMVREFEIERLDDYMARSLRHRHMPGRMEEESC